MEEKILKELVICGILLGLAIGFCISGFIVYNTLQAPILFGIAGICGIVGIAWGKYVREEWEHREDV